MSKIAIKLTDISKVHKLYHNPFDRFKEILPKSGNLHSSVKALENINLEIEQGTTVGILGQNGSGKSTLLQILAGVMQPSSGKVQVNGRISALLELGSGFDPEFTGLENVFLNASILGLTNSEIEEKLPAILEFAEIGDFINFPVKTYSSGMLVRLAFSVAVAIDPEILLVDEALAVGDMYFQHKCINKMKEIMEQGTTVIFVSHDLASIKALCQRAILLNDGKIIGDGDTEKLCRQYHSVLFENDVTQTQAESKSAIKNSSDRMGTGEAEIVNVEILNSKGESTKIIDFAEKLLIRIHIQAHEDIEDPVVGFVLRDKRGLDLITSNSYMENVDLEKIPANQKTYVDFSFRNFFKDDNYSVSVAINRKKNIDNVTYLDWINNAINFDTMKPKDKVLHSHLYPCDLEITSAA